MYLSLIKSLYLLYVEVNTQKLILSALAQLGVILLKTVIKVQQEAMKKWSWLVHMFFSMNNFFVYFSFDFF